MELNDSAKNGDVETAWESSEVGADAGIEYVPLMRVENSSSPSQQPNTATLNQPTIEGISSPREMWAWKDPTWTKFGRKVLYYWFAFRVVLDLATGGDGVPSPIFAFTVFFVWLSSKLRKLLQAYETTVEKLYLGFFRLEEKMNELNATLKNRNDSELAIQR